MRQIAEPSQWLRDIPALAAKVGRQANNTTTSLNPEVFETVAQEWDNCNEVFQMPLTVTVR